MMEQAHHCSIWMYIQIYSQEKKDFEFRLVVENQYDNVIYDNLVEKEIIMEKSILNGLKKLFQIKYKNNILCFLLFYIILTNNNDKY